MGCIQTTGSISDRPNANRCSTDTSHLWVTVRQRELIRITWPRLVSCDSDFERIGSEVFVRIFSRHPELIALFPFGLPNMSYCEEDMSIEEMASVLDRIQQHPAFKNHAAAFASAIGMAVDTLDDWDGDLTATLLQLGRMHSQTTGFTVQNFEVFAESLFHIWETRLECCLDGIDASLAEVNHAWEILIIFMMMKLRDGYHFTREPNLH